MEMRECPRQPQRLCSSVGNPVSCPYLERSAMKLFVKVFVFLPLLLLASAFQPTPAGGRSAGQDLVLKAADITPKLFPEHVFFRGQVAPAQLRKDRKSTRLNSSHGYISYAVFCL